MLADSLHTLLRRWPLALVAVLLALAAGVGVYKAVPPKQESKAAILLVPSLRQPGVTGPSNPYLGLGDSLGVVATVLQASVSDDRTARRLVQAGNRATYTVAPDLAENAGPILAVTTDDTSPAMAQRTLSAVISEVQSRLRSLQQQQNVPETLMISTVVLTSSIHPLPVHKAQVEKAVIAAAVVLIALIALILLAERLANRSRRRRAAAGPHAGERPSPAGHEDPAAATGGKRRRNRRREASPVHPSPARVDDGIEPEASEPDDDPDETRATRVYAGAERHD
jgi:hypothetical protein